VRRLIDGGGDGYGIGGDDIWVAEYGLLHVEVPVRGPRGRMCSSYEMLEGVEMGERKE